MKESQNEHDLEKSILALKESIDKLDDKIKKDLSFKRNFLLSISRWIGYALGATFIGSIIVIILAYLLNYTKNISIIHNLLDSYSK
jgi:hypothetical protein